MIKPSAYQYSFFSVTSLTLDHVPQPPGPNHHQEPSYSQEMKHAISSFLRVECFQSNDLMEFCKYISKMDVFHELGLNLFSICLIQFELAKTLNRQDQLEHLRESVYDKLQQIKREIRKRNEHYLKMLPLLYYAILKKMFTVTKMALTSELKSRISHVVFFQLNGELVSGKHLDNLIRQYFNPNYHKFIKEYSENITPLKTKNRSLLKSQLQDKEDGRFKKVGKENCPSGNTLLETNKLIMSKITLRKQVQGRSPKGVLKI